MRTKIIDGDRYVSYASYQTTVTSLRRQLAQAQLELDRTRARSTNLRKAIKGLERAISRAKAGYVNVALPPRAEVFRRALVSSSLPVARPARTAEDLL